MKFDIHISITIDLYFHLNHYYNFHIYHQFNISPHHHQYVHDYVHHYVHQNVMELIKSVLRPEFINRVDEFIIFNALTKHHYQNIVSLEIEKVLYIGTFPTL